MKWSEKKNPFKKGDRVLLDNAGYTKGTILEIIRDQLVRVLRDDYGQPLSYHWRQCKKLVKKKKQYPKELWFAEYSDGQLRKYNSKEDAYERIKSLERDHNIKVKYCIRYVPAKDQKK